MENYILAEVKYQTRGSRSPLIAHMRFHWHSRVKKFDVL